MTTNGPAPEGSGSVRIRLDIAYDGTDFSGWARQPEQRTVQGDLESALATVLRVPDVSLTVAGRTDAGVHATGQVAHVDLAALPDDRLARRLNGILRPDVRVRKVAVVPAAFDARFSALSRHYAYRITDAENSAADPLHRHDTLTWPRRLSAEAMHAAAQLMLGEHDFAAYCKRREGATTVRRLLRLEVDRTGDLITATVEADAFCHSMVRALIGGLLAVGEGRQEPIWPREVLRSGQRHPAGLVAPAHGLTLVAVAYPADGALAARAHQTKRLRSLGGTVEVIEAAPGLVQ
jgi:tRNA pseudouridine38-40 synthase